MKNQRTKVFQLRLTSDELLNLKEKAVPYQSVSNYIRKAVEEFTHVDVKQQIEIMGHRTKRILRIERKEYQTY